MRSKTSPDEEFANTLTHGAGVITSAVGTAVLVTLAALHGTVWHIVGSAIFGATLVTLYTVSTLYHSVRAPRVKARLRVLDHCAIFVLIAGTYTPFTLVGLRGPLGWTLFGLVWGLALAGVVFKLFATGRFVRVSTAMYLSMGWLGVVAAGPLIQRLSPVTLVWLVLGGILYTSGTAFFHNHRMPYAHAVWHVFVVAGSACHLVAVGSQL